MPNHKESCKECKINLLLLLKKLFGKVEPEYKIYMPARLNDLKAERGYDQLVSIYEKLQKYRGNGNFVKTNNLPKVDYWLPGQKAIIEFDELQHFTRLRQLSLCEYPDDLELGYDRNKWIELCNSFDKKDNDPPYRDEQRAWYDTLRDFAPIIKCYKPIVRLYVRDEVWCKINIYDKGEVEKLKFRYFKKL
jgi:hypothetical protein